MVLRTLVLCFLSLLWIGDCLALTCPDCMKLESESAALEEELKSLETQLEPLLKRKDYAKVSQFQTRITQVNKRLLEIRSYQPKCKDLCKPENIKMTECRSILAEIVKQEPNLPNNEVDKLYNSLASCYREWQSIPKR